MDQFTAITALSHIENGNNREAARVLRAVLEGGTSVVSVAAGDVPADLNTGTATNEQIATRVNEILAILKNA